MLAVINLDRPDIGSELIDMIPSSGEQGSIRGLSESLRRQREKKRQKQFVLAAIALSVTLLLGLAAGRWLFPRLEQRPFVTYQEFEGADHDWNTTTGAEFLSETSTVWTEYTPEGKPISNASTDKFFPGLLTIRPTTEKALNGRGSLKVTTTVTRAGDYKGYLNRTGSISGYGAIIHVLASDLSGIDLDYIQLCVPSHDWACSWGIDLTPGEWTPIVLDLGHEDKDGKGLFRQTLTKLAVQWKFRTKASTSFDLYFDSFEVHQAGPRNVSATGK